MKQFFRYCIIIIVFFSNLFSASIDLTNEEKEFIKKHPIITFSDVNWEPFAKVEGENYQGIFREYYNLVEEKTGLKFEFKKVGDGINFKDVLNGLKKKQIDMIDGSGKTLERGKYALFAGPFMQVNLVIASNGANRIFDFKNDVSKLTIAVAKGSTAYEYIKEKSYKFKKLIITEGVEEALNLVNLEKVDGMVENIVVVDYFKRKNNLTSVEISTIDDYEFKIYSIVRDDYPLLASILTKAINVISKEDMLKINSLLIQKTIESQYNSIELNQLQKEYLKNKKVITMCVDPSWEPLESINANGEDEGIGADLIKLIASRLHLNIELVVTKNWEESLEFSKSGRCDILNLVNQTPKREQWLHFTNTLLENPTVIIAHTDYPIITDLKHIKGTIAIPKGYAFFEKVQKDFPNLTIVPTSNETESLALVSTKKVDLTISPLLTSAYLIKKNNILNLKIVAQPEEYKNHLKIGVVKSEPMLKDILNVGINSIKKEELDYLLDKYIKFTLENHTNYTIAIKTISFALLLLIVILIWNYLLRMQVKKGIEKNNLQSKILFQNQKQAELGKLIANISHQWRDSLTKISYINLTTTAKLTMNQEITKEYLEKSSKDIEESLDFMSDTMQNFLDYYKPSTNCIEFDIVESIKAAKSIMNTKINNNNLTIEFDIIENITINSIRNQWMQIWINLINNSINQAIKEDIAQPNIKITIQKDLISFEDNCKGFKEDILDKFNNNTLDGLGLKMSKDIVNKDGWELTIINASSGVRVTIYKSKGTK
jgi:two-component system, NarL family, sensor histidine kinase EvgS